MDDSRLGVYQAPALLLRKETARVFLEPIARSAPGTDGVVDLDPMPSCDDIARLYFENGEWRPHERSSGSADANDEDDSKPLTRDSLGHLIKHVHGIRGYRNSLVHRAGGDVVSIPISFARSHLRRFLAFLPLRCPVSA